MQFLTLNQGTSFNRILGIAGMKQPTRTDYDRLRHVLTTTSNRGQRIAYDCGVSIPASAQTYVTERVTGLAPMPSEVAP